MSFEQLLEKMSTLQAEPLAKAMAAPAKDDKKIAAAAAEGEDNGDDEGDQDQADTADADDTDDDPDAEGEPGEDGDKPMAKSFALQLDDGTTLEAFDGTEMLKALTDRVDTAVASIDAKADQELVLKSLQSAVELIATQSQSIKNLIATVEKQGEMHKALQAKVGALSAEGRGTRSVRSAAEAQPAQDLKKSLGADSAPGEILAKSMSAYKAGRITGLDVTKIETSINMGVPVSAELMSAISSN